MSDNDGVYPRFELPPRGSDMADPVVRAGVFIELVKEGVVWADGHMQVEPKAKAEFFGGAMRPRAGHAANYFAPRITIGEELLPGWWSFRFFLELNSMALTPTWVPGLVYIGQPTEAPTEILHVAVFKDQWASDHNLHGMGPRSTPEHCPACTSARLFEGVWMATFRCDWVNPKGEK